jgi:hypothetical protein
MRNAEGGTMNEEDDTVDHSAELQSDDGQAI